MGWTTQSSILGRENVLTCSGAHPAPCSVGTGGPSPAVKWREHENDNLTS